MKELWKIKNDIKHSIDYSYNDNTIKDLYNLLIKFDSNSKTSSLKEFIKQYK